MPCFGSRKKEILMSKQQMTLMLISVLMKNLEQVTKILKIFSKSDKKPDFAMDMTTQIVSLLVLDTESTNHHHHQMAFQWQKHPLLIENITANLFSLFLR